MSLLRFPDGYVDALRRVFLLPGITGVTPPSVGAGLPPPASVISSDGGATDISAAVQALIDAAPPYGEVKFGAGVFNCRFRVNNKPGLRISGVGRLTILTHLPDPTGTPWNDGIITVENNSVGVRISDMQIQGAAIVPENTASAQTGPGPTVTVTGTPLVREFILIKIAAGGILGAATFDWSNDLGKTWSALGVTVDPVVALGATGLNANFDPGLYVLGTTYVITSTPGGGAAPTLQVGIVAQTGSHELEVDRVLFSGGKQLLNGTWVSDADRGLNACVVLNGVNDCDVHDYRITHIQGHDATDGTGYGVLIDGNRNHVHDAKSDFPIGQGRHHVYVGPGAVNEVGPLVRCTNGWYEQIIIRALASQSAARANRVHGNRCSNAQPLTQLAVNTLIGAITVGQKAYGNRVYDNIVDTPYMHGIMVTDYFSVVAGETPDTNTVGANTVLNSALAGVLSQGANGTLVLDNDVHDANTEAQPFDAIEIVNSVLNANPVRCRVLTNVVDAPSGPAAYFNAVSVGGGVTGCAVEGNALVSGTVGTFSDSGTGTIRGANILDGLSTIALPSAALGGGAPPTLGTIGGTGPTVAAQAGWAVMQDTSGANFWVPTWK